MIRVGAVVKIIEVASHTIIADAVKTQGGFRLVALIATHHLVRAQQWKSIFLVQLSDVVHQPIVGTVTSGAIIAQCILVNVGVARITVALCFFKNKAGVAITAIQGAVHSR